MRLALEGLPGVEKVEIHLRHDLFVVTLAPDARTTDEQILSAVRELSYTPSVVDKEETLARAPASGAARATPEYVLRVLEQARKERRLVVFDCYAEWCAPCKRMAKETFPDPRVKKLLDQRCVFVKVDVEKTPELAAHFETEGVPDI